VITGVLVGVKFYLDSANQLVTVSSCSLFRNGFFNFISKVKLDYE